METAPDPATGRRKQVSAGTYRTKREAEQRVAEVVSSGFSAPSALTLGAYLSGEWLASKAELSAQTRQQYGWAAGRITAGLGQARCRR
ncbi:MAG: hypothetical protein ACKVWR_07560 [Acidimicrobiales bacterium]